MQNLNRPFAAATFSRRKILAGAAIGATALVGYATVVEPRFRLVVTRYDLSPPGWPHDLPLTIAVISDLHASEPYMGPARIARVVGETNALNPDVIVLLGDYVTRGVPAPNYAEHLAKLRAPLGVHAVLGNHDWWTDVAEVRRALGTAKIPVLENTAVRIFKNGRPFWLLGLGDQLARITGDGRYQGIDDLPGTIAKVGDNAPAVLLAHEPDIFVDVPARISLTLSGHTHGGQLRLFGWSPVSISRFGNRFAYGHVVESNRHLVVSGGLGSSIMPARLGVPPEIVFIRLGTHA
jgi:predicted MPP superfamily phosphohydrolase